MQFWPQDWASMWVPQTPIVEIVVRGTVMYLAIFTLLRILVKRETTSTGITDLLVLVLLADAAQNAMAGGYESITDGILLVAVIIGWSYVLDWCAFHVPFLRRLIRPRALLLVENGQLLHRNMTKELLTEEELLQHLRASGVDDFSNVARLHGEQRPDHGYSQGVEKRSRRVRNSAPDYLKRLLPFFGYCLTCDRLP